MFAYHKFSQIHVHARMRLKSVCSVAEMPTNETQFEDRLRLPAPN